jgi:hypothetical protein
MSSRFFFSINPGLIALLVWEAVIHHLFGIFEGFLMELTLKFPQSLIGYSRE